MRNAVNTASGAAALLLVVLLGGCGERLGIYDVATTRQLASDEANYALKPDRSLIVFIRPKRYPMESAIFDITDGNQVFVASIPGSTKVSHYAKPGKRKYMVVGLNNADFMTTNLDPGKVYYSLITISWGARLWFKPFIAAQPETDTMLPLNTPRFAGWFNGTPWVENLPVAESKVAAHMDRVHALMRVWLPKWQERAIRPNLDPQDGQTSLYRAP